MIKDELSLDGNPVLNLASFVTTYMETEVEKLMAEAASKNFIDYEEYPQTAEIQNRCVSMIARLYNAPTQSDEEQAMGTSTVGSSEAIMLGTLAMKKRWQNKRKEAGKDYSKPNIVMNSAVQVCWEKAARYFEVEERYVYCTEDRYVMDPKEAVDLVDENTIGICAIIGTTYTGEYEDVKAINDLLVERKIDCPIHVDAASGGFVAPFVVPDLEWDFRLEKVISINVSGHKYVRYSSPPSPSFLLNANIYSPKGSSLPRRRLGNLALPGIPPQRTRLQHQLPRRRPSLLHPQLLQGRLPSHRPILPTHPPGKKGLHFHHDQPDKNSRLPLRLPRATRIHHHVPNWRKRTPARGISARSQEKTPLR